MARRSFVGSRDGALELARWGEGARNRVHYGVSESLVLALGQTGIYQQLNVLGAGMASLSEP